jgi:hypothetical protein
MLYPTELRDRAGARPAAVARRNLGYAPSPPNASARATRTLAVRPQARAAPPTAPEATSPPHPPARDALIVTA